MKPNFPKIWVLGASFETSNLGVNALAEASIKCLFTRWPEAQVILRTSEDGKPLKFTFHGKDFEVIKKNLWFSKNLLKRQNVYSLLLYAMILKILPLTWLKRKLMAYNPYFQAIMETDLAVDITAGDSFSDIYGLHPFIRHSLFKWLFILCNRKLIMLPQTYGPFNSSLAKGIARYLLKRSTVVYSRDHAGVDYVNTLLGKTGKNLQFCPDVAFVLDPQPPQQSDFIKHVEEAKKQGQIIIGFNISGLLYNQAASSQKKFSLQVNYQQLVHDAMRLLLKNPQVLIILIPHVYASHGHVESDPDACQQVAQQLGIEKRIIVMTEIFDHRQVKYLIGRCDFFLGSRMHSCIGAISQAVPTIGIAYSKKFQGVFESVGLGNCVVDLRLDNEMQILTRIETEFNERQEISKKLQLTIPKIKEQVLSLFDSTRLTPPS
jgi:polysaccharide pyruvyl transferase WcaK-like protein